MLRALHYCLYISTCGNFLHKGRINITFFMPQYRYLRIICCLVKEHLGVVIVFLFVGFFVEFKWTLIEILSLTQLGLIRASSLGFLGNFCNPSNYNLDSGLEAYYITYLASS